MRALACAAAALALTAASPAPAQEEGRFAEGSAAEEWGLRGEEKARFEARVTDILCELSGDCPEDCGAGRRQLGLVRSADGVLLIAAKNGQPLFTGAGLDLLPYCNETVEVDGLLVGSDEANPAKVFQIQLIRRPGEAEFAKTNRWTEVWNAQHPEQAEKSGPWFRKDSRVLDRIARDGWLGLGQEADAAFLKSWFE